VDVVTIVLLYIIALDGVRRGIDVTNGQRIQCISHLDNLDGEHVVGTSSRAFDVEGWIRGEAIASHTTNPMSLLPLKRACAPSLLPIL
jgi:hypothetical protein